MIKRWFEFTQNSQIFSSSFFKFRFLSSPFVHLVIHLQIVICLQICYFYIIPKKIKTKISSFFYNLIVLHSHICLDQYHFCCSLHTSGSSVLLLILLLSSNWPSGCRVLLFCGIIGFLNIFVFYTLKSIFALFPCAHTQKIFKTFPFNLNWSFIVTFFFF